MRIRTTFAAIIFAAALGNAQPLRSLKSVAVPGPANLDAYVANREALVALGKALFWDMQAGSDGRTACATCHFHAGADHRMHNQLADPNHPFPANARLDLGSFPFRKLADPLNRNSAVVWDTEMRTGSAGLFRRIYEGVADGEAAERGREANDAPQFMAGGLHVRRVTNRNSPSVINAVFDVRSFWDGRADRIFNGGDPFGDASTSFRPALKVTDGALAPHAVRLDQSSLASQAVGPILDAVEMSYEGRTWPVLGRKMLVLAPLAFQRVASDDSILGTLARADGRGLREGLTYRAMVERAFLRDFWESPDLVNARGEVLPQRTGGTASHGEFTQAEYNFPLFWGLAIQAYEATLVSDDSPFDRFMEGDAGAMSAEQQEGMRLFQQNGRCTQCHGGAEFSAASFTSASQGRGGNAGRAFQRTGVRGGSEDGGRGNAAFKSITLRNIELTGPYFHNGGQATLEQVIEFYSRGGDFTPNQLRTFNTSAGQRSALAAFLRALTDERVRYERAPFDHPELCVPSGHPESQPGSLVPGGSAMFPQAAAERWVTVPAVGSGGNAVPLQDFAELLAGTGNGGGRAHTMQAGCQAPLP
jgi:cytochrome c peroxidase